MALPKCFTKDVFIRLEGCDAFVSTVKHGWFYRIAKEFSIEGELSLPTLPKSEPLQTPVALPLKKRSNF